MFESFQTSWARLRPSEAVEICMFAVIVVGVSIAGVSYIRQFNTSSNPFVDQGPFWFLLAYLGFLAMSVNLGIRCISANLAFRVVPAVHKVLFWAQLCFTFGVSIYTNGGQSLTTMCLIPLTAALAPIFEVPFVANVFSLLGLGVAIVIIIDVELHFEFRRFFFDTSSSIIIVQSIANIIGCYLAQYAAGYALQLRSEEDARQREVETRFTNSALAALLGMNINGARKQIEAQLTLSSQSEVAIALDRFADVLQRWSPYVPKSVQQYGTEAAKEAEDAALLAEDEADAEEEEARRMLADPDGKDELVEESASDGTNLLRRRFCTIMHVHIFNFPNMRAAEGVKASKTVAEAVIERVIRHSGVVNALSPDSIMASFNCLLPCDVTHARLACQAALQIANDLQMNTELKFAIAIDTGFNFGGRFGIETRRAEVSVGPSVSLSMHLTSLAYRLGVPVMITRNVQKQLDDTIDAAPVDEVRPAFLEDSITVYHLRSARFGRHSAASGIDTSEATTFSAAFAAFRAGRLHDAMNMLHLIATQEPTSSIAQVPPTPPPVDPHVERLQRICTAYLDTNGAVPFPTPYVRRELQWETMPGEAEDDVVVAAPVATVEEGPSALEGTMAALKKQKEPQETRHEDAGLFGMFLPDDGGEAANDDDGDTRAAEDEGCDDGEVPTVFEDHEGQQWQRSKNGIGEGAFAQVFLGLGQQGSLAAMKCFKLSAKNTNVQELQTEVNVLAKLRHLNIVSYVSCALTKSHFIIVMEHVSGGSLHSLVNQFGPLPLQAVRRYLDDILRGLQFLHKQGIVHCDVKPHNALLSNEGTCKLSDFGSALNTTQMSGDSETVEEEMTVRGTSWYMAPEAARNEILPASDVWSVGITVIELLTGQRPWKHVSGSEANFIRELGKNEELMPQLPEELPEAAAEFVKLCLVRDPAMRPSVSDLIQSPFFV